jgi:ATP-binding cassette subfamily C (CFTR/MRP) protein 1
MATTLSQPYLVTAMIRFVQDRDSVNDKNRGYGLIAAFALNYTVLALATGWCSHGIARFLTKVRGCLIASIYEKTLNISPVNVDLSSATVLM